MIINKITVGYVVQSFDTVTRKFVGQTFIAADEVEWQGFDADGHVKDLNYFDDAELIYGKGGVDEPYLNFEMVQPDEDEKLCARTKTWLKVMGFKNLAAVRTFIETNTNKQ